MKRTVLVNLICAFIAVLVLALGVVLAVLIGNPSALNKPKLVISSESSAAVYDGNPLTNTKWHIANGELAEGEYLQVEVSGIQTDVGISENYLFAKVFDENGVDVSKKYNIEYLPGTLNVKARAITITASSDVKDYDGTPLTCDSFYVASTLELLPDHTITATVEGSITEVGETPNKLTGVTIVDQNGNNVTRNYNIKSIDGILIVRDGSGSDGSGGEGGGAGSGGGLDMSGSLGGGTSNSDEVIFTVTADRDGRLYLKLCSYGNYIKEKNSFTSAPVYNALMSNGGSAYYIVPSALDNSGLSLSSVLIDSKYGYYALPYYSDSSKGLQVSDVAVAGDATSPYTVDFYYWTGVSGVTLPSKYTDYEKSYRAFVEKNYLAIDQETADYMMYIIDEQGFNRSDKEIVAKVAQYIRSAAAYNLEYNTAMDSEPNPVIAFLSTYKEGVCRHYAAAATMLYRALGIPARYTVGFVAEAEADTAVDVTAKMAHAWVEVYIDGIGWINVEVTASSSTEVVKMEIMPEDTRARYEQGMILLAENTVKGFTIGSLGYTYSATIVGAVDKLGMAESTIEEFIIYSPSGEIVYRKSDGLGSEKFQIKYHNGIVQQYIAKVGFGSSSHEKTYDGTPLLTTSEDCYLLYGDSYRSLGYTCEIAPTGIATTAGITAATYEVTFYKDGVDCTDHFWIESRYGTLRLYAREITISAGSAQAEYTGAELTCNEIVYDESLLAPGDYVVEFLVEGSQRNIGASSNVLRKVKIVNSSGEDVTGNYKINIRDGILKVTLPG